MKRLKKSVLLATAALLAGSQLYAQPVEPKGPDKAEKPTKASAQLTSTEMKERAASLTAQVHVDSQRVQHLQTVARQQKDIIKLSCVNDKFVKLKAETNIFDNTQVELNAVIDTNERFAAFVKIEKAADATHKVREEAEACAGEGELVPNESNNSVTTPEIPDDPTTGSPFGEVEVEPPAYASPYN